jgi:hypothetical protein
MPAISAFLPAFLIDLLVWGSRILLTWSTFLSYYSGEGSVVVVEDGDSRIELNRSNDGDLNLTTRLPSFLVVITTYKRHGVIYTTVWRTNLPCYEGPE